MYKSAKFDNLSRSQVLSNPFFKMVIPFGWNQANNLQNNTFVIHEQAVPTATTLRTVITTLMSKKMFTSHT